MLSVAQICRHGVLCKYLADEIDDRNAHLDTAKVDDADVSGVLDELSYHGRAVDMTAGVAYLLNTTCQLQHAYNLGDVLCKQVGLFGDQHP